MRKNNMKLIIENWRQFENRTKRQLLSEKTTKEALDDLRSAQGVFASMKDEESRKQFLVKAFNGVSKFAVVVSVIPALVAGAKTLGLAGAFLAVPALLKSFVGGVSIGEIVVKYYNSIPDNLKKQFPNVMGTVLSKLDTITKEMVGKILDMPDTESAKNAIFSAIDLPDNLSDFIEDDALNKIIEIIKKKITFLATQDPDAELSKDSLAYAARHIGKVGGVRMQDKDSTSSISIY